MSRREAYILDTSAPIAVHDKDDIEFYKTLSDDVKVAWNRYAQGEADKFDENCDSYDSTNSYHKWSPCNFRNWVTQNAPPVPRSGFTETDKLPDSAGKIVGMVEFKDKIIIATEYNMFELVDGKLEALKFVYEGDADEMV